KCSITLAICIFRKSVAHFEENDFSVQKHNVCVDFRTVAVVFDDDIISVSLKVNRFNRICQLDRIIYTEDAFGAPTTTWLDNERIGEARFVSNYPGSFFGARSAISY